MTICTNCSNTFDSDLLFCPECGTRYEKRSVETKTSQTTNNREYNSNKQAFIDKKDAELKTQENETNSMVKENQRDIKRKMRKNYERQYFRF